MASLLGKWFGYTNHSEEKPCVLLYQFNALGSTVIDESKPHTLEFQLAFQKTLGKVGKLSQVIAEFEDGLYRSPNLRNYCINSFVAEIRDELRLVASVGVAPNKFVAKIASDVQKPDGFVIVEPHEIQTFLDPLPVGRLWGVGKVTGQIFEQLSIHTIGQLRHIPLDTLIEWFGSSGEHYWQLAHGIDERRVVPDRKAKSISNETTFAEDITDPDVLRAWMVELVEQVARRLRHHDIKGGTVDLKVRFANFKTITRSLTLPEPTNITHELLEAGIELLTKRLPSRHPPVRLLGFGVNKLDGSGTSQQQLFDRPDRERHQELDRMADQITAKFGRLALRRGARLDTSDDR